jgi:hypothetical protein
LWREAEVCVGLESTHPFTCPGVPEMIIVREIFTARPGQASKLAKLFRKAFPKDPNILIMTDLVGEYNTVVVERRMASFSQFVQEMSDYKEGKPDPSMDPKVAEEMSKYTEMYVTGRREMFEVLE